jgi:formate hydrogenlyase subunit 3/multisubunit Na+/H+ antiporter MnhD subunit
MPVVLMLLLTLPFAVALACLRAPAAVARLVTAGCGVACFGLVLALVPAAAHGDVQYLRFLRVDAVSAVFLLATGFLYAAVAVYSVGYLSHEPDARYSRRLRVGLNLFAWAMLAAPMMSNLALLWVAIEVTTVVSALLVAIENTDGAAEAAWKYVLLASTGLGLALLATIFAYYAGAHVLGQSYDLGFAQLLAVAGRLPHAAVQLAFVLAVVGFGAKMGLVPVHTWLPDAHSEAPTPVSALLSGSLLAISFGAPAALAGVLLHVLAHAAAKGNAFMGAGVLVRKFGTNRIAAIRGGLDLLPWSGPLFLLAIFALGAMPPFGLFRSEFEIVAGGLGAGSDVAAAVLIVGVTVAFFGLAAATTRMLMRPARRPARPAVELVPAGVLASQAGALVLLLLGVHPPAELNELFDRAVRLLGAGS